ncbi:MAG: DUF2783 domain-containing protein [Hyphomicrobiaceae bacterium]|nr:DUF2783 domain-containing protein [Hyphomicrobiaceae bacterium]
MTELKTTAQLADADGVYRMIIEAHRGLNDEASASLNARLVLVLANHIGDSEVIRQALTLAKATGEPRIPKSN